MRARRPARYRCQSVPESKADLDVIRHRRIPCTRLAARSKASLPAYASMKPHSHGASGAFMSRQPAKICGVGAAYSPIQIFGDGGHCSGETPIDRSIRSDAALSAPGTNVATHTDGKRRPVEVSRCHRRRRYVRCEARHLRSECDDGNFSPYRAVAGERRTRGGRATFADVALEVSVRLPDGRQACCLKEVCRESERDHEWRAADVLA
jgi:hypothetical protein